MKYIDYDLDIKVFPDGEKRLLDVDEYVFRSNLMDYQVVIEFILIEMANAPSSKFSDLIGVIVLYSFRSVQCQHP